MSENNVSLANCQSLVELHEQTAKRYGEKCAFRSFGKALSFQEVFEVSKKFSAFLQKEAAIVKGERVAVISPNVLHFPLAVLGGLQAGAVMVCINPLYTTREVHNILRDAQPKVLVVLENFAHLLDKIEAQYLPEKIIVASVTDFFPAWKRPLVHFVMKYLKKTLPAYQVSEARHLSWQQACEIGQQAGFDKVEISRDDLAFLQYTGGTTGPSKGAMLSHGNLLSNVFQATSWLEQFYEGFEEFRIATPLPLYHIFSLTANFFTFYHLGAENLLIINPRDLNAFMTDWRNYPIDAITGVNTLFNALIHHRKARSLPFERLKIVLGGGMSVQSSVAEKWHELTGKPIIEAYGLTEASPAVCIHRFDRERFDGSIGYPVPGTQLRVVDEQGSDLPLGVVGELWVQGPQVMQGYWNNQRETERVLTKDGWLKTGDLAYIDDDGRVFIVDRKKDLILISGFNVYPNEVEDVLVTHPSISESAVIAGLSEEDESEYVKAFVVIEPETRFDEKRLIEHCRSLLAPYKVPKQIIVLEQLPKNNIGKVLRKELRKPRFAAKSFS